MNQRLSQKRTDPVEELTPEVTLARRILKILNMLRLEPGGELVLVLALTRDGSILLQAGSGATTREMLSEREKRGGSGNE